MNLGGILEITTSLILTHQEICVTPFYAEHICEPLIGENTYIRRNGEFVPMHVNLHELYSELSMMSEQITEHPIFESRWEDRMPGDIIENF